MCFFTITEDGIVLWKVSPHKLGRFCLKAINYVHCQYSRKFVLGWAGAYKWDFNLLKNFNLLIQRLLLSNRRFCLKPCLMSCLVRLPQLTFYHSENLWPWKKIHSGSKTFWFEKNVSFFSHCVTITFNKLFPTRLPRRLRTFASAPSSGPGKMNNLFWTSPLLLRMWMKVWKAFGNNNTPLPMAALPCKIWGPVFVRYSAALCEAFEMDGALHVTCSSLPWRYVISLPFAWYSKEWRKNMKNWHII